MKHLILLIACTMLLGACVGNKTIEEQTPTPIPTSIIPEKPVYQVERGDVVNQISFSARIEPIMEKTLSFVSSGRVSRLYVKQGDAVVKGQLLAELRTAGSEYDLRRAQINLEKARLAFELARIQNASDKPDYRTLMALKQADVDLAQLALDELTAQVEAARIRATMDGEVVSLSLSEGMEVNAYVPVITLSNLNALEVKANVSNLIMNNLSEGMPVLICAASRPGEAVDGKIRRLPYPYGKLDQEAEFDKDDQSVRITLQGDWQKPGFELGDPVQVQAVLEKRAGVLWLPPQAIRRFEGRFYVVVQEGEVQRRVDVQTGLSVADRVEITEGLTEGQLVIAP